MTRYAISTLGCKVNQYESQQLQQALELLGLQTADRSNPPEVLIVNTCCVTHHASAKSRQKIRKLLKTYPAAKVFVTGCLPVGQGHELADLSEIIIAKDKNRLPAIVNQFLTEQLNITPAVLSSKTLNAYKIKNKNKTRLLKEQSCQEAGHSQSSHANRSCVVDSLDGLSSFEESLPLLSRYSGQYRAFLKVQDGCDAYCTYCIIPKIRTNVCSKTSEDVVKEAENLVAAGHQEIILTGIFLGAYGQKTAKRSRWEGGNNDSLATLVREVAAVNGLERLSLGSLEPLDVTDRLLEAMRESDKVAPHLHLPLQAGSARILRKMARQYSIDDYRRVIERVKGAFDRPAITTDLIVGFPGETESDFQQTLQVANETGFTKIHVFPFSVRKGTGAEKLARLYGRVGAAEIRRRAEILLELDVKLQAQFRAACKGMKERVLVERLHPAQGLCGRYFTVDVGALPEAQDLRCGQMVEIEIN